MGFLTYWWHVKLHTRCIIAFDVNCDAFLAVALELRLNIGLLNQKSVTTRSVAT